ncbi:Benzil reductase ((S)-benzoin forming) [Bacillus licheniformis]|nr:Benzil reductase ((S)-benzoin forming) [Bacillus licheniformis]
MQFFLITGASKGLGRALTEQALQEGAEVAALSRTISGEKREG